MTATISSIASVLHFYLSTEDTNRDELRAARSALADGLLDAGCEAEARRLRRDVGMDLEDVVNILKVSGRRVGRKTLASWFAHEVKAAALAVYVPRRDRQVNPDGEFDSAGRWYPSSAEECGDIARCVRSPSRAWPYSYLVACRTKKHAVNLVLAGVLGADVPADARRAAEPIRAALLAELSK